MTIRKRTERASPIPPTFEPTPTNNADKTAGLIAGIGLGTTAALHLLWATDSSWPKATKDELADLVVGIRPFPSPALALIVTGLIGAGTVLVLAQSGHLEPLRLRYPRLVKAGAYTVAGVLLIRGFGGLVASTLSLENNTALFRKWDLLLYSPLCIALGALALKGSRPTNWTR